MRTGPLPRFAEPHLQLALELIARYRRLGRKQLAKKLRVGEGSVRTILGQLKARGLITSSRGGHALTPQGRRLLEKLPRFVRVEVSRLIVGKVGVAAVVRGGASKVKSGLEQRDEAVKAGARGATVLVFRNGKLQFPGGRMKMAKEEGEAILSALKPQEGDAIVIGSGDDELMAEIGARAAVRSLVGITTPRSRS